MDSMCEGNYKMQNRQIIESIYMMLNMSETSSLERALKLDIKLKSSFIIGTSIDILISYQQRAFYKTIKLISNLPHPIVSAIASMQLPQIRKEVLCTFSIAYNSSSLSVPLEFVKRLLVYDESATLLKHLRENLGIHDSQTSDDAIRFDRKKFDSKKSLVSKK
jgi:SAC3 domain-containing protein 1